MARTFTAAQRADAVALVEEHGLAEAHRRTGIAKSTLTSWVRGKGASGHRPERQRNAIEARALQRVELREKLRTQLLQTAIKALERIDQPHVEFKGSKASQVTYPVATASAFQHYVTSAAIAIDKYRLEAGEATDRTERRDLTSQFDDHENDLIGQIIRDELARRADERAAQDAVEVAGPTGAAPAD